MGAAIGSVTAAGRPQQSHFIVKVLPGAAEKKNYQIYLDY
jgi:hypothetical protein